MNPTGALRDWPDADDSPAISHVPSTAPAPAEDLGQHLINAFTGAPLALQFVAVAGAVLLLICLLALLSYGFRSAVSRLTAVPARRPDDDDTAGERARGLSERYTHIIGVYGSLFSLANTLVAMRTEAKGPAYWVFFVGLAALFEFGVIVLVLRAWANAAERGRLGAEGLLIWLVAGCLSALILQKTTGIWRAATFVPLLVALFYTLTLTGIARRRRIKLGSKEGQLETFADPAPNPIRVLWRRAVALLGLVQEKGFGVDAWARRRKVIALAQLAYQRDAVKKAKGEDSDEFKDIDGRYHRELAKLAARYRTAEDFTAEILPAIDLIFGAADSTAHAAGAGVWQSPRAGGSGSAPGGSDRGSAGGNQGGSAGGSQGGSAGGNQGGSAGGNADESRGSNPAPATEGRVTCAEVMAVAQGWDSADLHARRSDSEVAHLFAVAEAAQVFGRAGKTAALRTYVLVMFAAGHLDLGSKAWNYQRIYREITGEAKRSTLPGQVARRIQAELAEDPAAAAGLSDELDELTRAGGSDA